MLTGPCCVVLYFTPLKYFEELLEIKSLVSSTAISCLRTTSNHILGNSFGYGDCVG